MKRSSLKPGKPLTRKTPMKPGSTAMKRAAKPMAAVGRRGKRMHQGKVPPTVLEQKWMDAITELGCIVCILFYGHRTPGAVHHLLEGGRRKGHLWSICLCDPGHHQNSPTMEKVSRHPYKKRFENEYGSEIELLEKTKELISLQLPSID